MNLLNLVGFNEFIKFSRMGHPTSFWDDPTRKGQTLAMGQRLDIRGSHSYNVRGASA